jgi:hypothetical protein
MAIKINKLFMIFLRNSVERASVNHWCDSLQGIKTSVEFSRTSCKKNLKKLEEFTLTK